MISQLFLKLIPIISMQHMHVVHVRTREVISQKPLRTIIWLLRRI